LRAATTSLAPDPTTSATTATPTSPRRRRAATAQQEGLVRASTRSAPAPPLASRQARPHLFTPLCFSPSCPLSRSVAASCSRAVLVPHDGLGQLLRAGVVGPTRERAAMRGTERSQQHGSRGHAGAQRGGAAPRLEQKKTVTRRKVRAQARVALPPTPATRGDTRETPELLAHRTCRAQRACVRGLCGG